MARRLRLPSPPARKAAHEALDLFNITFLKETQMSIDLVVPGNLSSTPQQVQDQNGNGSTLYLATNSVALNFGPIQLTTVGDLYHQIGYSNKGMDTPIKNLPADCDYWLFNANLVFAVGPNTGPTQAMVLTNGTGGTGKVGLQLPNLASLPASGSLDLTVDQFGNVKPQTSSVRFKENVEPLADDFHKILSLQPKSFSYKDSGQRAIGYTAEDLHDQDLTELVSYDQEGKPLSIQYKLLPIYMLEVLKEQNATIERLAAEIGELKAGHEDAPDA
jgi:hypothetical protein